MKVFFKAEFLENNGYPKLWLRPQTNNSDCQPIYMFVDRSVGTPISGENYKFGLINGVPTIGGYSDNDSRNIVVMDSIPQGGHRVDSRYDGQLTNGQLLTESSGGGAFGSGQVFISILKPGERVVSSSRVVWENRDGDLFTTQFPNRSELLMYLGLVAFEDIADEMLERVEEKE